MIKVYKLELEFEEPVSVVAESEDSVLKVFTAPTVEWRENGFTVNYMTPIIPASSLKGALRALFASLAKSLLGDCEVVKYHEENREPKKYKKKLLPHHEGIKFNEKQVNELKEYLVKNGVDRAYFEEEGADEELAERLASLSCPICLLFGSNYLAGALRFSDVALNGSFNRVTRVVINRALGKVSENKLFTLEMVEEARGKGYVVLAFNPELEELVESLGLECNGKNPIEAAKELWETGKKFLEEEGLVLGHSKSVGLGAAKVRLREL